MRFIPVFLVFLTFLAACAEQDRAPAADVTEIPFRKDGTLTFTRGGDEVVTIDIEIAESDSARQRGLMQRRALPEKSGMLFVFGRSETQSFWMANTPLSLDIMFVSADSQIVDIARYTKPFSTSGITSNGQARFVIEVPAGFADTYGITESDRVRWRRPSATEAS